ncbi:hypothetical protein FRB95_005648, partial [Tulasnella sp. JGI-2019a]
AYFNRNSNPLRLTLRPKSKVIPISQDDVSEESDDAERDLSVEGSAEPGAAGVAGAARCPPDVGMSDGIRGGRITFWQTPLSASKNYANLVELQLLIRSDINIYLP